MPETWPVRPLPAPRIAGDGFELRTWTAHDAAALAAAWNDAEIGRWTRPPMGGDDQAARWIAGDAERRRRAIALDLVITVDDLVVGEIGLSQFGVRPHTCAVGFWIAEAARGRGLAAAATRSALTWATEAIALHAALATTHIDNLASIATLVRAGFVPLTATDSHHVVYAWRS